MKLRQKLAMVLASAMVVTAVPVVTMAATTNSITNPIVALKGDVIGATKAATATEGVYQYTESNNIPELIFDFTNTYSAFNDEVYVEFDKADISNEAFILLADKNGTQPVDYTEVIVEDGKIVKLVEDTAGEVASAVGTKASDFVKTLSYEATQTPNAGTVTISKVDGTTLKVDLNGVVVANKNEQIRFELPLVAKEGDITAKVSRGSGYISNTSINLSRETVTTKGIKATFGTSKNLTIDGGEVAAITLDETVKGALNTITTKTGDDAIVTIELDGSADVVIDDNSTVKLTGKYGLTGQKFSNKAVVKSDGTTDATYTVVPNLVKFVTDDKIEIDFSKLAGAITGQLTSGSFEIAGIEVKPESRKGAQPGTVEFEVTSEGEFFETAEGKVAEIKEFAAGLAIEKQVELVAGKDEKEVTFTLTEDAKDSLNNKHSVYFTVEGAEVVEIKEVKTQDGKITKDVISDLGKNTKVSGNTAKKVTHVDEFELPLKGITANKANTITVTMKVQAEAGYEGDIVVKAESRSFDEDQELVIGKVAPAMTVEVAETTVKVGLDGQEMGAVTVKEANKGMLEKGTLVVTFDSDIEIGSKKEDIKVEGTSTLEAKVKKVYRNAVELEVTRESREAAELKLTGIKLDVNRSIAEGTADVELTGTAISEVTEVVREDEIESGIDNKYATLTVEDAIVVGTKNTEDLSNGTAKVVTTVSNGATEMIVNDEKVALAAPAYINGTKLMAPVRAVSKAFGMQDKDINYNPATKEILIVGNGRTIKLTVGSKDAFLNGAPMTLAVAPEIKSEATYVPVGDLARFLGLTVEFDNATKTATFKN